MPIALVLDEHLRGKPIWQAIRREGYSAEMLLGMFPTLELALIHKVIAFCLENKAEVDAYVARSEEEIQRCRAAAPRTPSIEELKARRESLSSAQSN
jgi:hypothetical protein